MTHMLKIGLLTLGVGLAFHAADSQAVVANIVSYSNAVNYCQAYTPGVSNTIRNRVIGLENVGTAPIAVTCNFTSTFNGDSKNKKIDALILFAVNNGTADATISCTMLAGTAGVTTGDSFTVTKSALVTAGGGFRQLTWRTRDNPTPSAVDMGNIAIGIDCILPPHMMLGLTGHEQSADNGVGS